MHASYIGLPNIEKRKLVPPEGALAMGILERSLVLFPLRESTKLQILDGGKLESVLEILMSMNRF
jgi:hypothetical protein